MIVLEVLNAQPPPQVGGHCLETSTRAGMGTGHRQDPSIMSNDIVGPTVLQWAFDLLVVLLGRKL